MVRKIMQSNLSLIVRKPAFCICENKDADQLRSNCAADHRLCFRYIDSTIIILSKSEISSLWPSSVAVQPGLCQTWSETPKTGFLRTRLNFVFLDGSRSLDSVRCKYTIMLDTNENAFNPCFMQDPQIRRAFEPCHKNLSSAFSIRSEKY